MSLYQIGGATYVQSGTPASAEANTPGNPNGIIGGYDPGLWRFVCPIDGLACKSIGSQINPYRCDNGHVWSIGASGTLYYQPYVTDGGKASAIISMYIPPTLG